MKKIHLEDLYNEILEKIDNGEYNYILDNFNNDKLFYDKELLNKFELDDKKYYEKQESQDERLRYLENTFYEDHDLFDELVKPLSYEDKKFLIDYIENVEHNKKLIEKTSSIEKEQIKETNKKF